MKPELYLCAIENDDATLREIVGWLNDQTVVKYSEQRHRCHSIVTQLAYLAQIRTTSLYWRIIVGKVLIGTITATTDKNNSVANMGLMIGNKNYWGKGYGFKAWKLMGDFLFSEHKVRKIEAGCMAANMPMNVICQKYGMVEEGRQDKHFQLGDSTTDLVHWGKFNEAS